MLVSCLGSDRHALEAGAAYRATGQADRTDAGFYQAGDWVKQNTSPEDVILYIWPEKVYLCTGRKAVGIPKASPDAFLEALEGWGVDYVLIALAREVQAYDMGEEFYLKPAIERYPARFRSVYESEMEPQVTVFQVVP